MKYITTIILTFCISLAVYGHDTWVEFTKAPQKGETAEMKFTWDHHFPSLHKEYLPVKDLSATYAVTPAGKKISFRGTKYIRKTRRPLNKKGTYLIVSGKKWKYWTQTTTGWKEGVKKTDVKNPLKGVYSGKFTKAVFALGGPGGSAWKRRVGHDLEIIPMTDPSRLKKGDQIALKIFLHGKPYSGEVKATYSGYSSDKDTFALKATSGKNGLCTFKADHSGPWLVKVEVRRPSRKNRLYDEKMYSATLTFNVK